MKTAVETPKNAPSRLACSFVIERLPLTISDVTPREPRIGGKSIVSIRRDGLTMFWDCQAVAMNGHSNPNTKGDSLFTTAPLQL